MSDQNDNAAFPETVPTKSGTSSQVPDTKPAEARSMAPTPDTKPAPVVKRQDTRLTPEVLAPPPRNARPYNGQKLGVKHDKGVDNIPANLLTLALVDLDVVDGVLTPGARTRVLDRAPWTGWPIVELT